VSGFWKAPRELARLRTSRQLSPSEWFLLVFVGVSGADRDNGIETTNEFLADAIGVHEKTVRRALRVLRARGFITFDDHRGRAIFTVRTTPALAELEGQPRTRERTRERTSATPRMSEVTSDIPSTPVGRDAASEEGSSGLEPRTRPCGKPAETETETEITNTYGVRSDPFGGRTRDPDQAIAENARAHPATGQGTVAAIVEWLREFDVPEFGGGELAIVGRQAGGLHKRGAMPELVAIAGLFALLRRKPELMQRLYGDLAAKDAGAIVDRDEWQTFLRHSNGDGPIAAIAERRRAAAWLAAETPTAPSEPCPECGTGGGRHIAGCPTASTEGGHS
jgi:hypothetical protein